MSSDPNQQPRNFALSDGRTGPPEPARFRPGPSPSPKPSPEPSSEPSPDSSKVPNDDAEAVPPSTVICELREYRDDVGRRVTEVAWVHGTTGPDFVRFRGHNVIRVPDPAMQQMIGGETVSYTFPLIGAETVVEAFEAWDAAARAEGQVVQGKIKEQIREQLRQQMQADRILVAPPGAKVPHMRRG